MRALGLSVLASLLAVSCALLSDGAAPQPAPAWIWSTDESERRIELRRSFEIDAPAVAARLWATGDDRMELRLNGTLVAASTEWGAPIEADVAPLLRVGSNDIVVWAANDGGAAGFCFELVVEGGPGLRVVSDEGWSVAPVGSPVVGPAEVVGLLGDEPWGELGPAREPERPGAALPADQLRIPPGFRAELVYSVPRVRQGSWVSLTVDDRGRLIASDQYGGLYRVTPAPLGEVREPSIEELDLDLGEAHGLLYAFGSLYVVVNRAGRYNSGLYRVRDLDGDDRFDSIECLTELAGSGEHGPHAVLLSPDGESLTLVAGNYTALPENFVRSRVPQHWAEDQVLPRLPDPRGHATDKFAPGGWVARVDPEGRDWELIASGFRNPYDIAFNDAGDLFTFDADMEWDVGLPWYRPTRVLHVTSGAEFGWRNGSGKWPSSYPDSLPSVVDVGPTSPVGITFGTQTSFPRRWRDALFVGDWAYGAIYAVHLEAHGASYRGSVEPFVRGEPLPVTDLAQGSDGALYFATGGRRTQSGLYRIWWSGDADGSEPVQISDATTAESHALRRSLERFHGLDLRDVPSGVWSALDHPDRHVRFAARIGLEHADPHAWSARALQETRPWASIEALLALVRTETDVPGDAVAARLEGLPWEAMDSAQTIAALRVAGLAIARERAGAEDFESLGQLLADRFPSGESDVDRETARLLAVLQPEGWLEPALRKLERASEQREALHYANVLRCVERGWSEDQRARFLGWFESTAVNYAGGASLDDYVDRLYEHARESFELPAIALARDETAVAEQLELNATTRWGPSDLDALTFAVEAADGFDAERGAQLFAQACAQCHRFGGEGGSSGPDLSGARYRFSPRDLLETVLDPSATVSDQYRDTEFWTHGGRVIVGRVESEDAARIVVRDSQDRTVELAVEDVTERRSHALSRMPNGLFDGWTSADVAHLTQYLLEH